jgi:hypothetical protein
MRKAKQKPYWEMTTEELAEATREFDADAPAVKGRRLTGKERASWERAMSKDARSIFIKRREAFTFELDPDLVKQLDAVAKRKHLSRSEALERGLRSLMALSA